MVGSLVGVDTTEPIVAFTFDDGPDETCTPAVLDVLRTEGARATFFVLADAVRKSPELLERVRAEGHEVGLHGLSHRAMTDVSVLARSGSLVQARRELARAGSRARWFRAPYGKQPVDTALLARALGLRSVMWSAYAREWEEHPVEWCVEHAAPGIVPGAIVLLHDGAAGEHGRSRPVEEIVALVRSLVGIAHERGFEVVPVGALVRRGRPRRRMWFRSWKV